MKSRLSTCAHEIRLRGRRIRFDLSGKPWQVERDCSSCAAPQY
jgi:hypothetical protein